MVQHSWFRFQSVQPPNMAGPVHAGEEVASIPDPARKRTIRWPAEATGAAALRRDGRFPNLDAFAGHMR
jgi:hypothetical protein